jgi:hypothetical protein
MSFMKLDLSFAPRPLGFNPSTVALECALDNRYQVARFTSECAVLILPPIIAPMLHTYIYISLGEQVSLAVTLQTCAREVLG